MMIQSQNYWSSNFENDSTPGALVSRPKAIAHSLAIKAEECASTKFDGL